ncbi:MAG: hypothetical protein JRJ51_23225 [Deltaproteobacteria bacterium]|nr:hypothetical protein [Deltaproteobacteria bacterium]
MEKVLKKIVLTLLLAAMILGFPGRSWPRQFRVIKVYDGDTIKVTQGDTEIIVRLVGVDAPEEMWESTDTDTSIM